MRELARERSIHLEYMQLAFGKFQKCGKPYSSQKCEQCNGKAYDVIQSWHEEDDRSKLCYLGIFYVGNGSGGCYGTV